MNAHVRLINFVEWYRQLGIERSSCMSFAHIIRPWFKQLCNHTLVLSYSRTSNNSRSYEFIEPIIQMNSYWQDGSSQPALITYLQERHVHQTNAFIHFNSWCRLHVHRRMHQEPQQQTISRQAVWQQKPWDRSGAPTQALKRQSTEDNKFVNCEWQQADRVHLTQTFRLLYN